MKAIIEEQLKVIEKENNVRILFACESGSRAWGFASPDSDYDVRFVYVHPKEFYLRVDDQRDVIELPINDLLDINGWDLRKALRLFRKSNGPLLEWLQSPIIYSQYGQFILQLRQIMPEYFSPRAAMHHYLSMTKIVFLSELEDRPQVRLKKYFYALRPILACLWIAERGEAPPMEFGTLRANMPAALNHTVDQLLQQKSSVDEKFLTEPIAEIHNFIRSQIAHCGNVVSSLTSPAVDSVKLDDFFRTYLV